MQYLTVDDVLHLARQRGLTLRDRSLLESAVARPAATAFGDDAYSSSHEKAAALLQSIDQNQAFSTATNAWRGQLSTCSTRPMDGC